MRRPDAGFKAMGDGIARHMVNRAQLDRSRQAVERNSCAGTARAGAAAAQPGAPGFAGSELAKVDRKLSVYRGAGADRGRLRRHWGMGDASAAPHGPDRVPFGLRDIGGRPGRQLLRVGHPAPPKAQC
ncbi:DUF6192 family protein [Actinoallomurus acaciae]|uniref:DUF6192 family protein n=1 Tax=Actinoallomurus acaciae TaxID=502577 RepID=A0ABV5Y7R1_9ACTN